MSDDSTSGQWEPPADLPVVPEPQSPQEVSWTAPAFGPPPPAFGPPPSPSAAHPGDPPGNMFEAPPSGGFVYPAGAQAPYRVDYLESPARRRSPAAFIAIGVVVLVLIGAGAGLVARGGSSSSTSVAGVASASASPQPRDSTAPSQAPSGATPAPDTAAGPLDSYLLPPGDVGVGTLMALIPGGRSVTDQATLDFCNFDYTSEKLRDARVQVQYLASGTSASNEFVRYRAGGAAAAYGEIQKAIAGCPSSYRESGGEVSDIKRLTGLTGLTKNSAAVSFTSTFTGDSGVISQTTTAIYQFEGDYFSGVYVYGTDADAVQRSAAKLGAASAKLLAEAAAGKPGTGGGPLAAPEQSAPGIQA